MINNKAQAYYLVNKIDEDLRLGKMENLVQQYLRSGIDVFSHQIYASTFAISNPFVKGFILAIWSLGQSVKTSPFHGGVSSSILLGITKSTFRGGFFYSKKSWLKIQLYFISIQYLKYASPSISILFSKTP